MQLWRKIDVPAPNTLMRPRCWTSMSAARPLTQAAYLTSACASYGTQDCTVVLTASKRVRNGFLDGAQSNTRGSCLRVRRRALDAAQAGGARAAAHGRHHRPGPARSAHLSPETLAHVTEHLGPRLPTSLRPHARLVSPSAQLPLGAFLPDADSAGVLHRSFSKPVPQPARRAPLRMLCTLAAGLP